MVQITKGFLPQMKSTFNSILVASVLLVALSLFAQSDPLNEHLRTTVNTIDAPIAPLLAPEAKGDNLTAFLEKMKKEGKVTTVEGTIEERSLLPDPKKSDYPNCRFSAHFMGNTILSGEICPREVSLIIEGFENYKILNNNKINKDDKVVCSIIPFELLPEEEQATQIADDLELFLLESYYVLDIKTIKEFSDNEFIPISGIGSC